ncbi:hypothetical protein ACWGDE_16265 [Streptomyces sp. NPDC054956]
MSDVRTVGFCTGVASVVLGGIWWLRRDREAERLYPTAVAEDVLSEMLTRPGLADRFIDSLAARDNRRIHTSLPDAVTPPPEAAADAAPGELPGALRLSYARGRIVEGGTDERPVFTAAGYRWEVGKARRIVLETLWDGAWHTLEEVRGAVAEES